MGVSCVLSLLPTITYLLLASLPYTLPGEVHLPLWIPRGDSRGTSRGRDRMGTRSMDGRCNPMEVLVRPGHYPGTLPTLGYLPFPVQYLPQPLHLPERYYPSMEGVVYWAIEGK